MTMMITVKDLLKNQVTALQRADTRIRCTGKMTEISEITGKGTTTWTRMESELKKTPAVKRAVSNSLIFETISITTNR